MSIKYNTDHPCLFKKEFDYIEYPLIDDESDNVLRFADDCCTQISARLSKRECVLVHCVQGVSRSVALVTAFIMRLNASPFSLTYSAVKEQYPEANIADNFKQQLEEYGSALQWDMSLNTQAHRLFRSKYDMSRPGIAVEIPRLRYLCRKCRTCLFLDIHMIHVPCDNYQVECMHWMKDQVCRDSRGALNCPKCASKVGQFSWAGIGNNFDLPGFVITKSKVDEMPLNAKHAGDSFPSTLY